MYGYLRTKNTIQHMWCYTRAAYTRSQPGQIHDWFAPIYRAFTRSQFSLVKYSLHSLLFHPSGKGLFLLFSHCPSRPFGCFRRLAVSRTGFRLNVFFKYSRSFSLSVLN